MKTWLNDRLRLLILAAAVIAGTIASVLMEINIHYFTHTATSVIQVALVTLLSQIVLVAAALLIKTKWPAAGGALIMSLALPGLCALIASLDPGTGEYIRVIQATLLINILLYTVCGGALLFLNLNPSKSRAS